MTSEKEEEVDDNADDNRPGVVFPRWFVRTTIAVGSLFMGTVLPWSIWVTTNVMVVANNLNRIQVLEKSAYETSTQLKVIDVTKQQGDLLREGIEAKLDRMDIKIESLQRDFDRQFGRPANPNN